MSDGYIWCEDQLGCACQGLRALRADNERLRGELADSQKNAALLEQIKRVERLAKACGRQLRPKEKR